MLSLAEDYALKRTAFGKPIAKHALHQRTLANMEIETRACFALCFKVNIGLQSYAGHVSDLIHQTSLSLNL